MKKSLWVFAVLIAVGSMAGWLWHARRGSAVAATSATPTRPIAPVPPPDSVAASQATVPTPVSTAPASPLSMPASGTATPTVTNTVAPNPAGAPAVRSSRDLRGRFSIQRVLHRAVVPLDAAGHLVERTDILELAGEQPRIRIVEQLRIDPRTSNELTLKASAMIADSVMVKLQPGLTRADVEARLQTLGARLRQMGNGESVSLVEFPLAGGDPLPGMLARLKEATDVVATAEPDYIVTTQQVMPNDPGFVEGALWGLHNTGQEGGVAGQDIDAPEAWALATDARDVIVAVIDTGIRLTHVDLAENLWVNPGESGLDAQGRDKRTNGVDDDGNGFVDDVHGIRLNEFLFGRARDGNPMDDNGHGTHVAGIIGAVGNNGRGVAGVAWRVRLMPVKFLNGNGWGRFSDAIEGIHYARRMGARVCNNSWGGEINASPDTTLLREAVTQAGEAGMVIVCAAGNDDSDSTMRPMMPANFDLPMLLAVASLNRRGALSDFSNYGAAHLAAPGESIWSTFARSDNDYGRLSGTSMASPHVAGAAALLRARYPNETAAQIAQRLVSSATDSTLLGKPMLYRRVLNLHRPLAEATLSRAPIVTVGKRQFQSEQGPTLTLEATVTSETPVRLQWQRGDTPIPGATTATLRLPSVKIEDSGRYALVATNTNGTAYGWPILVEVFGPPAILQQPVATTAAETSDVQLSVYAAANGDPRLRFQWFFNGAALDVPNSGTLALRAVAPANAGDYHVIVSNTYGQTKSATVRLTVVPAQAPAIVRQPTDLAITADQDAVFSAEVTGIPRPTLQWRKDGIDLPGAVESTLRITRAQVGDAGRYTLVATNARDRVTSLPAQLTVAFAPVAPFIARQPIGRQARYGETIELTAVARGSPTPTLQWRYNGVVIAGATAATYKIERARIENAGDYSLVATNSAGTATSDTAAIVLAAGPLLGGWSWRAPMPQGAMLDEITYAEGRFIAAGRRGTILTSPDGIVWTVRPTGSEFDLYCMTTMPGRVVAAGRGGVVLTSADGGLTWEKGSVGQDVSINRLAWGNGRLLAYSASSLSDAAIFISTDARTWTQAKTPPDVLGNDSWFSDLIFADTHFLAAGQGSALWRSADGVKWQLIREPEVGNFIYCQLAYGGGMTIMADSFGNVRSSVDQVEWVTRIQGGLEGGIGYATTLKHVGGTFVLGLLGSIMMISQDGMTWERKHTSSEVESVAYGGGLWAICGLGGRIATSPDLAAWTRRTPEPTDYLSAVAYGPAGFVAVGTEATRISRDGILWSTYTLPQELRFMSRLQAIEGRYVGFTGARQVGSSSDGINWTSNLVPEAASGAVQLGGIARGAGRYVLVGGRITSPAPLIYEARIYTSTDLVSWTTVSLGGLAGALRDVIYDGRRFVAVGDSLTTLTSVDGVTWAVEHSGGEAVLNRIVFDGATYVATSRQDYQIFLSTDLKRWTPVTLPKSAIESTGGSIGGFADLLFTAGQFIGLYNDGRTLHSVDGRTWTESILPPILSQVAMCAGNNTLVVIANEGSIFQSGPLQAALDSIAITPARQLVARGQPVRFEIDTFGIDPGAQQWRKDGAELPGQSRAVFEIASVEPSDVGAYDVRLRRDGSEAKSQSAYLAVMDIPARFEATGGSGRIVVTAPPGFTWTIGTLAPWIKFDGEAVGVGSGGVDFRAEVNTGELARSATFVFGGRTFTVTQAAPAQVGRLANLSSRGGVQASGEPLIVGFVITGPQPKRLLLRGAGPALAGFGLGGTLGDPRLQLHSSTGAVLQQNDNWNPDENELRTWADRAGAFPFTTGSRDAALLATLPAGSYTLQLTGAIAPATGLALAEIYELVGADEALAGRRLVNLSTRGHVGAGDAVLIGGFVISGSSARRVLIRGVGPTLAGFGVAGALADPELEVLSSNHATLARNDNWDADANAAEISATAVKTGAFALPAGSRDAAVLMTLPPGAYTVHVRGVRGATGVGLFEVYEVSEQP